MKYLTQDECPNCGQDCYQTGLNLIEHGGLPVFNIFMFEQITMECGNCGCKWGTGEMDWDTFEDGEEHEELNQ